ncbi:2-phytyl-1,4-beta-naphthoquinone methyltransferase, chloroplastic-like [Andrographis paniculata]|uniref:2-phytyl-1,4-beta-naphthoquinone methyltransferase, chloroplastic-like n=1 Tax=Andrographis paniculata TaxID=175694 RepID=UPI0021E78A5E|nr:2-phytyl-1,4-beta-naphthoquinone methyltransferase, chloroplastic-like [Andrographis paniculata]
MEDEAVRLRHDEGIDSTEERQDLFDRIAPFYDKLNDVFSLGMHRLWKRWTVSWSGAKEGDMVLDVCCGSGDLSFLLSQTVGTNGKVIAIDFSKDFLQVAASRHHQLMNHNRSFNNIEWFRGDATNMPFPDSTFDAVTMGFGLRNIIDKKKAMEEIHRVLKPGSKVSVLDFNKSTSWLKSKFQDWAIGYVIIPIVSLYGLKWIYEYVLKSIREYMTGDELEKLALEVGFSEAKHHEIAVGLMGVLVAKRL